MPRPRNFPPNALEFTAGKLIEFKVRRARCCGFFVLPGDFRGFHCCGRLSPAGVDASRIVIFSAALSTYL